MVFNSMNPPLKLLPNHIHFAVEYLGTPEALAWVGFGFDPLDNNDERVKRTREMMDTFYAHVPYGMSIGNKQADGTMTPMTDANGDGYYELDVSWWPEGAYRIGYHSTPGTASPFGLPLGPNRDADVSWANFHGWPDALKNLARPYLHHEKNGAGLCFRILIRPDRTIEPFGDATI